MPRRPARTPLPRSAFAGFRFPPEVITLAVRWYLRYGLSYRDVEELLAERGIDVDHVTVYRWVQRFPYCSSTLPGGPNTEGCDASRGAASPLRGDMPGVGARTWTVRDLRRDARHGDPGAARGLDAARSTVPQPRPNSLALRPGPQQVMAGGRDSAVR